MSPSAEHCRLSGLKDRYDIIVIGGGIQGATMVWEAASRGLSALLIEQNDFGSGVSANSLKVIHGGIRYLQNLDIGRMRQSIRERRTLLRIAPHLVTPMRCIIPAYRSLGKGRFALWMGTRLYDCASADRNHGLDPARRLGRSHILSVNEFQEHLPNMLQKEIIGGGLWYDASVHNSERLVLSFVMSAKRMGADVCNYVQAEEIIRERGFVRGVMVKEVLLGNTGQIQTDVVMDCSGPWLKTTQAFTDRHYAKAMNLIIRRPLADCAFGIRTIGNSKRALFFTPWREGGMIGTWYERASPGQDPGKLSVSRNEVEVALAEINSGLAEPALQFEEVTAVHLGLLPALKGYGEAVLSDRFLIADSSDEGAAGLFRVQTVKYTTARDVSVKALKEAEKYLSVTPTPSMTHVLPLYGGDIGDVEKFYNSCLKRYAPKFPERLIMRLANNYGSDIHVVMDYVHSHPELADLVPGSPSVLQAELAFILDHEMVRTLADLIFRRTDLGTFAMPPEATIRFCADFMADFFGWNAQTRSYNMQMLFNQFPRWIQAI